MMAHVVAAAFSIASGLLLVSGASKVLRPAGVLGALASLGARLPRWAGRGLGLMEMSVGAFALAAGGVLPAVLVGSMYFGFALVVVALLRRGNARTCGCFGEAASPPSRIHVAFDMGAAGASFAHVALGGWGGVVSYTAETPGGTVVYALFIAIGIACSLALLTILPEVVALTRDAAAVGHERHERHRGEHDHGSALRIRIGDRR